MEYLGVYFLCNTGLTDIITDSVRKVYGKFNNAMAVLGKHSNDMSTLQLVKSYCLPTLLYGCEVWHLNDSNMQKISVAWNNSFRRIFSCCWRESVLWCLIQHVSCNTIKIIDWLIDWLINHYNTFVIHCRCHTCYTSANYSSGQSHIVLILLCYGRYLVACIRLLLL